MTWFRAVENDLVGVILDDHQHLLELFREFDCEKAKSKRKTDMAKHIIKQLALHDWLEVQFLYPTMQKIDCTATHHALDAHMEAETLIEQLLSGDMDPESEAFREQMSTLITDVRRHMMDEEFNILPQLRKHFTVTELVNRGELWEKAKACAPQNPRLAPALSLHQGITAAQLDLNPAADELSAH
ncbi:hypothetical protein CAOG_008311 [Capsaspora owczarzaki ATCC 30864]|uniref:Hemerythrin-like domain-containing protein n=1 Tax=Capsaspora owczarzaki (strain ATCC 30864) TaxID=595528 RepID=A0A0D2UTM6_CAPO3|nr:hypothetical protein CAOG_008311 [Capsaspora owczarzaki ATCC 30864]